MQNMITNNPYYIGDAIIVMFGFSVLICHPPNLLDKFGEKIWRELEKMRWNLIFLAGGQAHVAYFSWKNEISHSDTLYKKALKLIFH